MYSEEMREKIREDYRKGINKADLRKKYSVSPGTIDKILGGTVPIADRRKAEEERKADYKAWQEQNRAKALEYATAVVKELTDPTRIKRTGTTQLADSAEKILKLVGCVVAEQQEITVKSVEEYLQSLGGGEL